MYKPIFLIALALILSILEAFSQSPQSFKYQAVVRDGSNSPLISQSIHVRMSILEGSISGTSVYTETHQVSTDNLGLISLSIGEGSPVSGDFMAIAWGQNPYFLQLELDETGGTNFQFLGASQLMSVPYSLYADKAGTVDNLSLNDLSDTDVTAPVEGSLLSWDGSSWVAGSSTGLDADRDSTNELQKLSLNGNILNLYQDSISGVSSVALPFPFKGGAGITLIEVPLVGSTIVNTGDIDANDDITNSSIAGGDLSGTFFNISIDKIKGRNLANSVPADGDILKWNGTEWAPASDDVSTGGGAVNTTGRISGNGDTVPLDIAQQGASMNQVLMWNDTSWIPANLPPGTNYNAGEGIVISSDSIINTGDTDPNDDITTISIANGDVSGNFASLSVDKIKGNEVSATAPVAGQALKWTGTLWAPTADENTTYSPGTGIAISPTNEVSNTGDTDPNDDITTISIANGDVSGNFASLSVDKIKGNEVSATAPAPGQALKWNGTLWVPTADENTTYSPGTGIAISPTNEVSNTGDTDPNDDITTISIANGDVSGNFASLSVDKIKGNEVSATAPAPGQALKWNGTLWVPTADENTTYSPGTGIAISPTNEVSNTGDTDPNDDITTISIANGDVSGTFDNLTVTKLRNYNVSNTPPNPGEVLKWDAINNEWAPDSDNVSNGSGAVITNPRISGDGSIANPLDIAQQGATPNQVLKWNGTLWAPTADENTTYTPGTGIAISPTNEVSNTGDTDPNDDITTISIAGGDVSGNFSSLSVDKIKGNEVSATAPAPGQALKWNGTLWVPTADENTTYSPGIGIAISPTNEVSNTGDTDPNDDITTISIANGDVSGNFSSLSVDKIKGNEVSATAPAPGQALKWNGTLWAPTADENTTYSPGTGIAISPTNEVSNTGDTDPNDDITTISIANGDVSGNFASLSVDKIRGNEVSATAPAPGQALKWNGTLWVPTADENTTYSPGTGIAISPTNEVSNTGDTDPNDDITTISIASGDVSGNFASLSVDKIKGSPISATAPAPGQALKWNGTLWAPTADENTTYSPGIGIAISPTNEVSNTGDTDPNDDITNTTGAGGDLSGTYPDPTVVQIQTRPVSSNAPQEDEVLKWNGSSWAPGTDSVGTGRWELNGTGTTTFYNAGKVSIGTDSSTHQLQISGNNNALRLIGEEGSYDYGAQLNFGDDNHVFLKEFGNDSLQIHSDSVIWLDAPWVEAKDVEVERLFVYPASSDDTLILVKNYDYEHRFSVDTAGNVSAEGVVRADTLYAFGLLGTDEDVRAGGNLHGDTLFVKHVDKSASTFRIDHPLDPANKYLFHSVVESPDMMNVYNGNITTDAQGFAKVDLPDYFMALNKDFRYQLTVIGTFAQAIIKEKVNNNRFVIQTSEPNVEVSWQITGIRQDKYAEKNRIEVEVDKAPEDRGYYLHPDVFDQPASKRVGHSQRKENAVDIKK